MQKGKSSKTNSDISLQNLEERFSALTGKPIHEYSEEYSGEEEYQGREEKLINIINTLPPVPLDDIHQESADIFSESLGKRNQLREEKPLVEKEKPSLQPQPTSKSLPSQELRQRKVKIRNLTVQQVSDYTVQKMLNEKLIEACKGKKYKNAGLLVRQGANPHAQDKNGQSAISYARNTNNTKLLKILEDEENKKTVFPTIIQSPNQKKEKLPLPAYTTFGSIIGGTLGASGCLLVASVYASSWAFPPAGVALTIIGGCMALGFIAGIITNAIISKSNIDSTTPFLKTEKDNNNEKENKNQTKTIEVSDQSPSMNS